MSRVTLKFLGSGDAFGSGGRFQTCMLQAGGGDKVVIDCGASSLIAMKLAQVNPSELSWVILTHLHGDHFGGLPFLVLDGQFNRRAAQLVVAGPQGTRARVEAAMEVLFPGSSRVARRFSVDFIELTERVPYRVGPAAVTPFLVEHPSGAPSHAVRVEYGGKVIAYTGDTEWTDALLDVARGADVFVCEAYFFERKVKYHLNYATLLAQRQNLECRRVVLTHMSAEMLAAGARLEMECAHDGQEIIV